MHKQDALRSPEKVPYFYPWYGRLLRLRNHLQRVSVVSKLIRVIDCCFCFFSFEVLEFNQVYYVSLPLLPGNKIAISVSIF